MIGRGWPSSLCTYHCPVRGSCIIFFLTIDYRWCPPLHDAERPVAPTLWRWEPSRPGRVLRGSRWSHAWCVWSHGIVCSVGWSLSSAPFCLPIGGCSLCLLSACLLRWVCSSSDPCAPRYSFRGLGLPQFCPLLLGCLLFLMWPRSATSGCWLRPHPLCRARCGVSPVAAQDDAQRTTWGPVGGRAASFVDYRPVGFSLLFVLASVGLKRFVVGLFDVSTSFPLLSAARLRLVPRPSS